MIKQITTLSAEELCAQTSPIIKLIVDVITGKVFWIPITTSIEHIQAMAEILKPLGIVKNFVDIEKKRLLRHI